MKKVIIKYKWIILIGIIVLLSLIVIITISNNKNNNFSFTNISDAEKFKKEYEKLNNNITKSGQKYPKVSIPSDNIIKYATIDDVLKIFEDNQSGVIYFGYPKCLYCRSAVEVLLSAADSTELDTIYYLDVEDTSNSRYKDLYSILGNELTIVENGKQKIEEPLVIFVGSGNIFNYNIGTLPSQEDPFIKLDESQKEGLKGIYSNGINDVLFALSLSGKTEKNDYAIE